MPYKTTVGKLLLKQNLPPGLHAFIDSTDLDKQGLAVLFERLAAEYPNEYRHYVSKLTHLGFEVASRTGATVRLADLYSPINKKERFDSLNAKLKTLKDKEKDPMVYREKANDAYQLFVKEVTKDLVDAGVKKDQTLAKIIRSGSRGSPVQYMQTVFAPVLVQNAKGEPLVDFPITHSFAEGLSLPEYLATSFGSRAGEAAKKLATADAGYFSKQLSRVSMTVKIEEHDCETTNGISVSTNDSDTIGAYLASPVDKYKRNNEITTFMLSDLRNKGIKTITARSPVTCQSSRKFHHNAVCQLCAGKREKGVPEVGDYLGISSTSSMSEPLSQGQLSLKHTSGSATGPSVTSGFDLVKQLATIPKHFRDKASVAEEDGKVSKIVKAPQGGSYIHVGKREYYVPVGVSVKVKPGDLVEAGDILSDGVPNPADIVRLKGIGEGRMYFADAMKDAFDSSGMGGVNRRNFQTLAKGMIDHVRIENPDGYGDYLPGEVVSYQVVEKDYTPRLGASRVLVDLAYNKYLEEPVMHYTIGTRITQKIIAHLKDNKISSVLVHKDPPLFTPEMQRIDAVPEHEPDWMHQMYTSYLERKLVNLVNTGASSNLLGPSPVPGLAYGVGFGDKRPR